MNKIISLVLVLFLVSPSFPAVDIDSNDYIGVQFNDGLYLTPSMAISFWAKSDVTDYAGSAYVVSMWDWTNSNRMWTIRINAVTDEWNVFTSNNGVSTANEDTGISVTTNWDHFVFFTNSGGNTWGVYYNGERLANLYDPIVYSNQGSTLTIGGLMDGYAFNGKLDDVRIYNRSLSANEVLSIYNSRCRLNITDGLIGYWPMDEYATGSTIGDGTRIIDRSGTGNHGTWVGGTSLPIPPSILNYP